MDNQRIEISIPEQHFTLFNTTRSGKPEVIVVNDALLTFTHTFIFPWHLVITIEAEELASNGMPTPSESEVLWRVGGEIEALVLGGRTEHRSGNALFLARSTWDGYRELLFQVHDPEITNSALQRLLDSRSWERPWEYQIEEDDSWAEAGYIFQLFKKK
jgi:hypothetical protein